MKKANMQGQRASNTDYRYPFVLWYMYPQEVAESSNNIW